MIVNESEKDREQFAKLILVVGLVILLFFVVPLIHYLTKGDKDKVDINANVVNENPDFENYKDDQDNNSDDVVDNSSIEDGSDVDNTPVQRDLNDPFYDIIYDHMAKLKRMPYISIPYNYQPKDNYLPNVATEDGKIHVFAKQPIMIYVPKNEYYDAIAQVFVSYNYQFKGLLSFKATNDPKKSDIKIVFRDSLADLIDNDSAIGVGVAKDFDENGNIKYSELYVLNRGNLGYKPNLISVYNVMLHEVAHCIGVLGHSPNENDVMYKAARPGDNSELRSFSDRDVETIKIMYSGRPDLINSLLVNVKEDKLKENLEYAQDQNNSDSYLVLGDSYYNNNQKENAVNAYKKAIQLNPDNPKAYLKIAHYYIMEEQYDEALSYLKISLQKSYNPEFQSVAYDNIAYVYIKKNDYNTALTYYDKALKLTPKDKDKFFNYIETCYVLKRKDLARNAYYAYMDNFNEDEFTDEQMQFINWIRGR